MLRLGISLAQALSELRPGKCGFCRGSDGPGRWALSSRSDADVGSGTPTKKGVLDRASLQGGRSPRGPSAKWRQVVGLRAVCLREPV
jgi:hypothetical protein